MKENIDPTGMLNRLSGSKFNFFQKKNHSSTPLLNDFRGILCDPDQFSIIRIEYHSVHWTYILQRNWLKNAKEIWLVVFCFLRSKIYRNDWFCIPRSIRLLNAVL